MFQKSRILAVAALTAGTVGLCASAASAGTYTGPSGDSGGLLNLSHNQVSSQNCGNEAPVNTGGVQVPVDRVAAALGLLSTGNEGAAQDSSCKQAQQQTNAPAAVPTSAGTYSMEGDGWGWTYTGPSGDSGGLVNVSHNQVPLQVCNNNVPVNTLGVQVPLDQLAGALGILSTGSQVAAENSSCKQGSAQANG